MKKLFISGAMSGVKLGNFPAFFRAEERLSANYEVQSPAQGAICLAINHGYISNICEWAKIFDLTPELEVEYRLTRSHFLRNSLLILLQCDTIYMLDGWLHSEGAMLERMIAVSLKMEVLYESDNGTDNKTKGLH